MDDDLVASFTAITSADPARARQYLGLTDGNLEQAIQLFFDSPNLDFTPSEATSGAAPPASATGTSSSARLSAGRTDAAGVVHIDSDDEEEASAAAARARSASAAPPAVGDYEGDEAMARRLQEELYGESGGGGGAGAGAGAGGLGMGMGEGGVRAPMARTTETLVGNEDEGMGIGMEFGRPGTMNSAVMEHLFRRDRGRGGRPGIFNQRDSSSVWDAADENASSDSGSGSTHRQSLARATGGASEASAKSSMLAELYRPPFDIMSRLSWEEARGEGRAGEKWLLVNVQDPSIFDCQVLNRDVWKHAEIKETVRANFIFMQWNKDEPRAMPYLQYYFHNRDSADAYPHVAIVDPRTGEQVKVWSGRPVPAPADFLMQLHEFLARYSLKANARNPVATRKAERPKALDVDRMSEEEMLEMAMRNSLAQEGVGGNAAGGAAAGASAESLGPRDVDPDALTREEAQAKSRAKGKGRADEVDLTGEADEEAMNGAAAATAAADDDGRAASAEAAAFDAIPADRPHAEPPADPARTTRVQFRHAGGRVIRRFDRGDPVRRMYEWLKAEPLEGMQGKRFEMSCLGRNLIGEVEKGIVEAGVAGGTVMVEGVD
ncbi:hypothetical protein BDY21DRAFT_399028 [Lineolata rhizophorae]|uniref:UAS domain-containing protein n=1 Tax=Lineolata rhizophorae TaxID=578093 RepID=A0A6A6NSW9_9PEZI|nr:hypothetical protein BDY21DRAFT_399028 [Lineolata rhizophorae]